MATRVIAGTQNLGAIPGCLAFRPAEGSPKVLEHGLSGPEALGLYDLKDFLRGLNFEKIGSYLSQESPDQFTESH